MIASAAIFLLFISSFVHMTIYLYNTLDSPSVDFYDCIPYNGLPYCRRPETPIILNRTNRTIHCHSNGTAHLFSSLRSNNINVSTVLHQWNSSLEKVEQYSRYMKNSSELDGHICQCTHPHSFGKNCEYLLPFGTTTFEEILLFENTLKSSNSRYVQEYGDMICYETLECNSGLLCLDWRAICDGVQQCMSGVDEESCDKLEYNECENDEYRCMNGMCIPAEYFVDGTIDCLDWSDELPYYDDLKCPKEVVSSECDDRICPPYQYSCGDGQCIVDRFDFQIKQETKSECRSRRDQYFLCETHLITDMWTLPHGRCYEEYGYNQSNVNNLTSDDKCQYYLLCDLSGAVEAHCPCGNNSFSACNEYYNATCLSTHVQYPNAGIMAPYILFFYRTNYTLRPEYMLINGTIKCDGMLVNISDMQLPFISKLHQVEDVICQEAKNRSLFDNHEHDQDCYSHPITFSNHSYRLSDVCHKSKACVSTYRIRDGFINCADGIDEKVNISLSSICSAMHRYRFRCSADEPTCLSVSALGNGQDDCKNRFDELWFGTRTKLSDIHCNKESQTQCTVLREYIEGSWGSNSSNRVTQQLGIPFHSYCDTFWNLASKEDENISECKDWWICAEEQWQCDNGQCIDPEWVLDEEWDCSDASDEDNLFYRPISNRNLAIHNISVLSHNFTQLQRKVPFSSICNLTTEFPCLLINVSSTQNNFTTNRPCISRHQIGDGHIDCYGGMDERNTWTHCSQSSMLGYNFRCNSSNKCVPYWSHCYSGHCPGTPADQLWCAFQPNTGVYVNFLDVTCFNGSLRGNSRCNGIQDCNLGEDEYMCRYKRSSNMADEMFYRTDKESIAKNTQHKLHLIHFPSHSNITQSAINSASLPQITSPKIASTNFTASRIAYHCNRGVGILMYNGFIACFCPPQYYGQKCQYQADRISVLLHLNLSQSIYTTNQDTNMVLKILLLFLFNNQTINNHIFHVRPTTELIVYSKKMVHLLYSRSFQFLQHKQQRYFNRSNIISDHLYSIRIEIYEKKHTEEPLRVAVWQHPIYFDYLPVFRLAKVLRLTKPYPCASDLCHPNEECYPLLNDPSKHICLCKSHFTGDNCSTKDQHCANGYCSTGSLCRPEYRGVVVGDHLPLCVCRFDRYGEQCDIKYDRCLLSNPCLNNGSCFVASQPNTYACVCTDQYHGTDCQLTRAKLELHINESVGHVAAVIQYFDIDFVSMNLLLANQQVCRTLPPSIIYRHMQNTVPEVVVVKIYSSPSNIPAELYMISVHINVASISATTQLTESNRCLYVSRLVGDNQSQTMSSYSPMKYHHICQNNTNLLCFRDDIYLCICNENYERVDCFGYDDKLDECSHCLAGGQCIRGDRIQANSFICLCPPCYSGNKCQFNSNSFAFTLDQLFFVDLTSSKQKVTVYLLIISALLLSLIALPNNIFSFVTFCRRKCLCSGIGQYLFYMSIINQINLTILTIRLIHLTVMITGWQLHSRVDYILCKLLSYCLTCFTRVAYWLVSFVATERVYTTVFLRGQWLKQPKIARRLIVTILFLVFSSGAYELIWMKSVSVDNDSNSHMCVIEFPLVRQSLWMHIHQIVSIIHFVLPLLINLCCTITIMSLILRAKIHLHMPNRWTDATADQMNVNSNELEEHENVHIEKLEKNIKTREARRRFTVLRDVVTDNKEMITRPALTLVPSLFSLFALPFFIASFSLGCQNLENSPMRYLPIVFYFVSFVPQIITFFLYVYPSSFYYNEWHSTNIGRWMVAVRQQSPVQNTVFISTAKEETVKNLSECNDHL